MAYTVKRLSDTSISITIAGSGAYLADMAAMTITPRSQTAFWRVLHSPCQTEEENAQTRMVWVHVEGVATDEFSLPASTSWKWVRNGAKVPLY